MNEPYIWMQLEFTLGLVSATEATLGLVSELSTTVRKVVIMLALTSPKVNAPIIDDSAIESHYWSSHE